MRIPLDGGGETTLSSSGTADGSSTTDGLGNAASISQTRTNSTDALALEASKKYQPPMAKAIRQKIFECDGVEVYDEYYWFRDRSNPKVLKYLEDENAYAEAMMEDTSELQDALYEVLGSAAILSLSLYLSLLFFFF
jgi:flagellar motor switch protein FliG